MALNLANLKVYNRSGYLITLYTFGPRVTQIHIPTKQTIYLGEVFFDTIEIFVPDAEFSFPNENFSFVGEKSFVLTTRSNLCTPGTLAVSYFDSATNEKEGKFMMILEIPDIGIAFFS